MLSQPDTFVTPEQAGHPDAFTYTFIIKEDGRNIEITVTRAMLAITAIATLLYQSDEYYYLNLLSSAALLIAAIFIKSLMVKFRVSKMSILSGAAIALLIVTHSIAFALILLVFGYFTRLVYRQPVIAVNDRGVTIKKSLASSAYQFSEFSNIVLKDTLLTLDFKDNKLIQVSIDETRTTVDENAFNYFVKRFLNNVS